MNSSHKVVALIQARIGSRRFPGKMLRKLSGHPLIEWVLRRVQQSQNLDAVVLATTNLNDDDPLVEFSNGLNVPVYRGSENDVLGRFVEASKKFEGEIIVRICADNPFVAPEEIDRAVSFFLEGESDYVFNHIPQMNNRYPDGLGVEVMRAELLESMNALPLEPRHREHVTSYIWDHTLQFKLAPVPCPPEIQNYGENVKLDIDTPADLERLGRLLKFDSTPQEILKAWQDLYGQNRT